MGFFGRIFGKKRGGTLVGNFIRQWAWNNSEITDGVHLLGQDVNTMKQNGTLDQINSAL